VNTGGGVVTPDTVKGLIPLIEKGIRRAHAGAVPRRPEKPAVPSDA
jgi:hypothetical protein